MTVTAKPKTHGSIQRCRVATGVVRAYVDVSRVGELGRTVSIAKTSIPGAGCDLSLIRVLNFRTVPNTEDHYIARLHVELHLVAAGQSTSEVVGPLVANGGVQ